MGTVAEQFSIVASLQQCLAKKIMVHPLHCLD